MHTSLHIKPFAFDRIFAVSEASASAVRLEDLQHEVVMLKAEVQRLRDDQEATVALARADGFDAGVIQARSEREAAYLAAADALQATLEGMDNRLDGVITQIQQDAAEVAFSAAEVLAARALAEAPAGAIDEAIGRVLKQVSRGQELLVRVHPALVGEVQRLVADRQASDRRRLNLQVAGDEKLAEGDAHIEWDQGGLVLDATLRAEAIRTELIALLPAA
jgi:flagellar assembly protein FliH